MRSKITKSIFKWSIQLLFYVAVSIGIAHAQPFQAGKTYVVNGQPDLVAPIDTFVNLSGAGNAGALTYLNANGLSSAFNNATVTIMLDAGYTGVEPNVIQVGPSTGFGYANMAAGRPVVLRPRAGLNFTISTTATIPANGSLFRIFASSFFTIEGSGTPGQRNITFNMGSNNAITAKVIDVVPSASTRMRNVSINNCVIVGNSVTTSTSSVINTFAGIYFGGTTTTPSNAAVSTNLNISYNNNLILAVANGIYHRGRSISSGNFAAQDTGINITNNIIGGTVNPINAANTAAIGGSATAASGVYLQNVANSTVSNNFIGNTLPLLNLNGSVNTANNGFAGIRLASDGTVNFLDSNIRIVKNRIYNIFTNVTSQGVFGVRVSLGTQPVNSPRRLLIANNSISRIAAVNGTSSIGSPGTFTSGILVDNTTNNVGLEVLFNSINLIGDTLAGNSVSACFSTGSGTTGGIILLNNSFSNRLGGTASNVLGYQNYVISVGANVNPFTYSNFNNLYCNTFGGGYAFIAGVFISPTEVAQISTLGSWVTRTTNDSNSYAIIPPLTNDTILTVADGFAHRTYNRGYSLPQLNSFKTSVFNLVINKVSDDIFGNPRTGLGRFTSIGCHQWTNGDSVNFNSALRGGRTYNINGTTNFPVESTPNTGSFRNLAEAISYLNSYGISGTGNVVLQISSGYERETTWIPAAIQYPGNDNSKKVIIRPAVGVVDTIWSPNVANAANTSVFRFMGVKNLEIDGSFGNNLNPSRNLTFMFRPLANNVNARVIGVVPTDIPSQYIGVSNVNILGNTSTSAINTYAGIYVGHPFIAAIPPTATDILRPAQNFNFTFSGNFIQGVRNGIAVRNSTAVISNLIITKNIIGGTVAPGGTSPTTFVGGAANQAGIFLSSAVSSIVDSNVIRNCLPSTNLSNGFSGIEITELAGAAVFRNRNITVSRNFIYNLVTATGSTTLGIKLQLGVIDVAPATDPINSREIYLINNHISNILSRGAATAISAANPAGIFIDAATPLGANNNFGIYNNTINMSGDNYLNANSGISALYLGNNIRNGVSSINNIFGVTANRNNAGNMYSVIALAPTSPFSANGTNATPSSNFNAYFVSGKNPTTANNILMATPSVVAPGLTTRVNIIQLRAYTNNDISSFNFPTRFVSDTLPNLVALTAGARYKTGSSNAVVLNDIYNNSRATGPNVGAVFFDYDYSPLQPTGVYLINGDTAGQPRAATPFTGSFKNLRSAVDYLNAFGTELSFSGVQPTKLLFSNGYVGETDTFTGPITVLDFPGNNFNVPVIVSVNSGRSDTIKFTTMPTTLPTNTSLIRIANAKYFGFDGSNNGSTSRDLTIMMPSALSATTNKIIEVVSGLPSTIFVNTQNTTDNFVRNCNLIGNSTTSAINTFSGIYMGGFAATPSNASFGANDRNEFRNNFIGACQYGVYLRSNGVVNERDNGNVVIGNTIGGNIAPGGTLPTNYFGGINNAAAIFSVGQSNSVIKNNNIQNNVRSFSNPRGIELGQVAGTGSNTLLSNSTTIDGNIIKNIISTVAGSSATGIYVNFGNTATNDFNGSNIFNNMISAVAAPGNATLMSGVYGIAIDAATNTNFNNPNINIHFNSINLGAGNTITAGRSACLAIAPSIFSNAFQQGLRMSNNLFTNKLGGSSTSIQASAVVVGSANNPFNLSENNNYLSVATNATNSQFVSNANGTAVNYNSWDSINLFTGGDYLSTSFNTPFTSDTNLFFPAFLNSVFYKAGTLVSGISTDVNGTPRASIPSMGAHEYEAISNIDSVAPRIVSANSTYCVNNLFRQVSFVIYDKNYDRNSFVHRLNVVGPEEILSQANKTEILGSNNNRTIIFTLPFNVPVTSPNLIEYKLTAFDITGNSSVFPTSKPWDTLTTSITSYPYTMNFENGMQGWSSQSVARGANWNLQAFGSNTAPAQSTENGVKCALFPSATLPAGSVARLISPCFSLDGINRPILRFRFSRTNFSETIRDSVIVRILVNGFDGPILKLAVRPSPAFPFADWETYEACLNGYKIPGNFYNFAFDGYSVGGGQNMMIDSIQVLDDTQLQTISNISPVVCNASQPVTITIPNSDPRYTYRVFEVNSNNVPIAVLDSLNGNNADILLRLANRQKDTLRYYVSAINYGSELYVDPLSTSSVSAACRNDLPGGIITTLINRFTRPKLGIGGYIIPDLTAGAFNGSANDGDVFVPDAVKVGKSITYEILTPNEIVSNSSYGTKWTIASAQLRTNVLNLPADSFKFTPPTPTLNARVTYVPAAIETDSLMELAITLRYLETNCDTTIFRYVQVAEDKIYNFVTNPRRDTACTGQEITFTTSSNIPGSSVRFWDNGDGTTGNFANNPKVYITPGVYRVILRVTSNLGITDTVSRLITVLPSPTSEFTLSSNAIVCQFDSTIITSQNTKPGITYLWTLPGNVTRTTKETWAKFNVADTNYSITLRVTDPSNGCVATRNNIYPSFAKPKANFTVTNHCQNSFMPYVDSSSIINGDRLGYAWSFSSGETRISNQFQIKFQNSGTYIVKLKLTSAAGCEDTMSKPVTVFETPQPNFTTAGACTNDSTSFTNTTTYSAGVANASYVWDFGDNSPQKTTIDAKHKYLNNNSGEPFFVKLIAGNKFNVACKDSVIKEVIIKTAPKAEAEIGGVVKIGLTEDKVCQGNTVTFTSKSFNSSGADVACNWTFGNGNQSAACSSFDVYQDQGTFTWSLRATSEGCVDTRTGTITVVPKPVVSFTNQWFSIPSSIYTVNNRQVFTPSDLITDRNSYAWNFGDADSSSSNQRVAEFIYNKKGTYNVRLTVNTIEGCVVVYTDTVKVDVGVGANDELAGKFDLSAYPNPFSSNVSISLNLPKNEKVSVIITDVLGREISAVDFKTLPAGKHNLDLNPSNFISSGTYFAKIKIGEEVIVKSLIKQ